LLRGNDLSGFTQFCEALFMNLSKHAVSGWICLRKP
jgi:hypothetical protein